MDLQKLWEDISSNAGYLLILAIVIALILAAAILSERFLGQKKKAAPARKVAMIGMFSAVAFLLMLFEFPLLFLAPSFYKLDFSEVPILICAFALGPTAGVICELVKNLLNLIFTGTTTAFVGEFANFAVGCSFVLPASILYLHRKNKKTALWACGLGTLVITVFGSAFNALYLLPAFSSLYGMELSDIIEMGHSIYPIFDNFNIITFVSVCVAPLNFLKGAICSVIVMLVYKPISSELNRVLQH